MGPDGLSSLGGYPGTDDEGREMQRSLDQEALLNDFFAGFEYLMELDACLKWRHGRQVKKPERVELSGDRRNG
jgi:hypothetical protein